MSCSRHRLQTDRLDDKEKFISIWKRAGKDEPLTLFVDKFPRNAAMVFSEVWKNQLEKQSGVSASLVIEDQYMEPYKRILDWINLCVDEGNDIKFPEVSQPCSQLFLFAITLIQSLLRPIVFDQAGLFNNVSQIQDAENPLHVVLDVISVANYIKVPPMSLQEQLKKSAIKYARKALIESDYVERLYNDAHPQYLGDEPALQEAAAASIFEAWWTRKLDEPKHNDFCSFLEQMRGYFPKLDDDLNGRFEEKKAFIEQKREERKSGQRGGGAGQGYGDSHGNGGDDGNGGNGGNGNGYGKNDGASGDWGNVAAVSGDELGEWGASAHDNACGTGNDDQAGGWTTGDGGW